MTSPKNNEETFDWQIPRKGSIALCSLGLMGIITSDGIEEVTYQDGNKGSAYTGIQLNMDHLGGEWSSRNPVVIGHITELEASLSSSIKKEKLKIIKETGEKLLRQIKDRGENND